MQLKTQFALNVRKNFVKKKKYTVKTGLNAIEAIKLFLFPFSVDELIINHKRICHTVNLQP